MRSILPLILSTFFTAALGVAQDADTLADTPAAAETETQMGEWIDMLESPRYSDRAEASVRLGRLGVSAIEALQRVAANGSAEASGRAFDILKRHHASEDLILKAAAREALGRIAEQSDHPQADAAERLLRAAPTQPPQAQLRRLPPQRNVVNRRVQIQIKISDGVKDITVDENGKRIRFIERADGIQVERSDGKGGTRKSKFKDREALQEKDAEAYRALKGVPKIPDRGNRIRQPGNILPPAALPLLPDDVRKRHEAILKHHQEIRKQHQQLHERLRKIQPPVIPPPPVVPPPPGEPIEIKPDETLDV